MENNIERLTIKEIAPFLPYELKAMHNGKELLITGLDNHLGWCYRTEDKTGCSYTPVSTMKPLLRNISCLTKTIQHEGREFIPIVELYKISNEYNYNNSLDYEFIDSWGAGKILKVWHNRDKEEYTEFIYCDLKFRKDRTYGKNSFAFGMELPHAIRCDSKIYNQWQLFQKLAEWHINFVGIPEHLYINKETIKTKL